MKQRFSEEQIIGILKQQESGVKTADICREHNPPKGHPAPTRFMFGMRPGGTRFGGIGCPLGG